MVNAQEWLDENYPRDGVCRIETVRSKPEIEIDKAHNNIGKRREETTSLFISKKNLEGRLNLQGFSNLEELRCWENQLTSLDLSNCPNLTFLQCMQNELTELDLTNNPKLEFVDICANQIRTNLSIFSHLVNLKELHLGWRWNDFREKEKNVFSGDLKDLVNCQNLESLIIDNQKKITGELKDLFPNVKRFSCRGTSFAEKLWPKIRELNQEKEELENELEIEQDHAKNMDNFYRQQFPYDSNLEHVRNELSKQILELNHENKQLKKQNQELQDKLELTEELLRKVELEPGQKLAAQVEIPPK